MRKLKPIRSMLDSSFRRSAVILGIPILIGIIWLVPKWQTSGLGLSGKDQADVENTYRQTLLQGIGGLFFFVTAYFSWRNLQTTEKNYRISEDKQITERFSKAVEMLGNKDLMEVRLGGIYILARIAGDSPEDHWTVMEVLTAFIRERSRHQKLQEGDAGDRPEGVATTPTDIQAALNVIGERESCNDPLGKRLDLSGANLAKATFPEKAILSGANFREANFSGAILTSSDLSGANFRGAILSGSNLSGAILSSSDLSDATLSGANLTGADLSKADLIEARLIGANLIEARLISANLGNAHLSKAILKRADLNSADLSSAELIDANLVGANLTGADLSKADLSGANLKETDLRRANLKEALLWEARNWTDEQLGAAKLCKTQLPEGSELDPNRDC